MRLISGTLLVLFAATRVWSHACGPTTVDLNVGDSVTWQITADLTEVVSSYEPSLGGDIDAADVTPAAFFQDHHGTFTIDAKAPGVAELSVFWSYEPTEASAICKTTITVADPNGGGSTPAPPQFQPANGLVIPVFALSSTLSLPVRGTIADDDGDIADVTVNGVAMVWTETATSLGGGNVSFRGAVPFADSGVDAQGRHPFALDVRVEDQAGHVTESTNLVYLQLANTLGTSQPPADLRLTPTDGLPLRVEADEAHQIPVRGTVTDVNGDLVGVTVNEVPMVFTRLDNSLSSHGQYGFTGSLPLQAGASGTGSFPLNVSVFDMQGGSIESRHTLDIAYVSGDANHTEPVLSALQPADDERITVVDPQAPVAVHISGQVQDDDGDLAAVTANGHPLDLTSTDVGRYVFSGEIPLAPADWDAPIRLLLEDMDGHRVESTTTIRLRFDAPTAVTTELAATPEASQLAQNYPNPFNSSTVIEYRLDTATTTDLTIYNLAGQQVRRLEQGVKAGGHHVVIWDGRDALGQPVASGVYLYRLTTARTEISRRLLVLR